MGLLRKALDRAKRFLKDVKNFLKKEKKKVVRYVKKHHKEKKSAHQFAPGRLLTFNYDAKHKQHRYDRNPLVVALGPSRRYKGIYLGINIHWLPMSQRVLLASLILELREKRGGDLVYDDVKPLLKKFEGSPILRSYIYTRVSNTVVDVPEEMFLKFAALSFEDIQGGDLGVSNRNKVR
jgi:hypothetical protein